MNYTYQRRKLHHLRNQIVTAYWLLPSPICPIHFKDVTKRKTIAVQTYQYVDNDNIGKLLMFITITAKTSFYGRHDEDFVFPTFVDITLAMTRGGKGGKEKKTSVESAINM